MSQSQRQSQSQTPPPRPPPPLPPLPAPSSKCGQCGSEGKWILHQVRFRGIHRRLCTTCVLQLHPSAFCPVCFHFYDGPPALSKRFNCTKCSSFTHADCLSASASAAASAGGPFLCPPCASPSPSYFDARPLDGRRHALLVLCAARISAASMAKALVVARAEAERRVREAAVARKRARDAIDNLALVVGRSPASALPDHRPPVSS